MANIRLYRKKLAAGCKQYTKLKEYTAFTRAEDKIAKNKDAYM